VWSDDILFKRGRQRVKGEGSDCASYISRSEGKWSREQYIKVYILVKV
jgi:hypothetical protein